MRILCEPVLDPGCLVYTTRKHTPIKGRIFAFLLVTMLRVAIGSSSKIDRQRFFEWQFVIRWQY